MAGGVHGGGGGVRGRGVGYCRGCTYWNVPVVIVLRYVKLRILN